MSLTEQQIADMSLSQLEAEKENAEVNQDWDSYNLINVAIGNKRRENALEDFDIAKQYAESKGFQLKCYHSAHFQLICFIDGRKWIYNLYPGNRRVYIDQKCKGPFLELNSNWTLKDVIDAVENRRRNENGFQG